MIGKPLFGTPLIVVAHPDDETLGCSAILQRADRPVVVFATDGAPFGYGLEKLHGSRDLYSEMRFQEAIAALRHVPKSAFYRLTDGEGQRVSDQHLFESLRAAAHSLVSIVNEVRPTAIVSHAYEGGHIDHDACSFVVRKVADAISTDVYEFPLYWRDDSGTEIFGPFKDADVSVISIALSRVEVCRKTAMLQEYRSQLGVISMFPAPRWEYIRRSVHNDWSLSKCTTYSFENRRPRLASKHLIEAFAQFDRL